LRWLAGAIAAGELHPVVGASWSLGDGRAAFEAKQRGGQRGKPVLLVTDEPRRRLRPVRLLLASDDASQCNGVGVTGYDCHTASDQCINDCDCSGLLNGPRACVYTAAMSRWQCETIAGCM
jgi:hypothetical protein